MVYSISSEIGGIKAILLYYIILYYIILYYIILYYIILYYIILYYIILYYIILYYIILYYIILYYIILYYIILYYIILYYIISPLYSDYSINNHSYPSIFNNCVIQIDPVHLHDNLQSCLQMLSSNNRNADACVKSLHGLKIGTRSVHVGSRKKISDLS